MERTITRAASGMIIALFLMTQAGMKICNAETDNVRAVKAVIKFAVNGEMFIYTNPEDDPNLEPAAAYNVLIGGKKVAVINIIEAEASRSKIFSYTGDLRKYQGKPALLIKSIDISGLDYIPYQAQDGVSLNPPNKNKINNYKMPKGYQPIPKNYLKAYLSKSGMLSVDESTKVIGAKSSNSAESTKKPLQAKEQNKEKNKSAEKEKAAAPTSKPAKTAAPAENPSEEKPKPADTTKKDSNPPVRAKKAMKS